MTKEEVKIILKHHFPKCKINKLKEFPEGFNNIAYDVSITNPKKDLVVKILKCKFHKNLNKQAKKEQSIYKIISKKYPRFPHAQMIITDNSKKVIDKPYLINKKIPGSSLSEVFDKMKNKEEVFEQLGSLKAKLHSIKFKKFGYFDDNGKMRKTYDNWYLKQCKEVDRIFKGIVKNKSAPQKFIQSQKSFWKSIRGSLKEDPIPSLCQGDPSYSNVIVDKKKGKYYVRALIDFEFAHSGDPMNDIGRSWKVFTKRMLPYLPYLIKGYKKCAKLPEDWELRVFFYQWKQNINTLEHINNTDWRGLTKKENLKRRQQVKEQNIKQANKMMEVMSK